MPSVHLNEHSRSIMAISSAKLVKKHSTKKLMHLENLSLVNFKNYDSLDISFSQDINCFVGYNGSGKTNLLDAIHYLSMTKSAFNSVDQQIIRHNQDFFVVRGAFIMGDERTNIHCSLKIGQKKTIKKNKKEYGKISEHIGLFPSVMIAPYDTDLIREGSETRRKFFDSIISQINQAYLQKLIQYNHILKQRNSLLKQFAERRYFDQDLLSSYNAPLIELGSYIFEERRVFLAQFEPVFLEHFKFISSGKELPSLIFRSALFEEDMEKLFRGSLKKDLLLQRTTTGIHKDDFEFEIDGIPVKKFGSQGQQKSFVIALKLAQFDMIKRTKGFKPLLLLDDIFDKLDELRIQKLMTMVAGNSFGQIFVTDARSERTVPMFKNIGTDVKIFHIEDGQAST